MKRLTLEEIGKIAGVSRATVSRVVNGYPHIRPEIRERVLNVIWGEGYTPNFAARALVTRRTHVIGVMIPQTFSAVFQDPYYFPTLLQGIAWQLNRFGYAMLLWIEDDSTDLDTFFANIVRRRLLDGLIIASIPIGRPFIDRLIEMDMPLVTVERPTNLASPVHYVTIDNREAARVAVEHLIALGRRRIATITGDLYNADGVDRLAGYEDALQAAGIPLDPALIIPGTFTRMAGTENLQTLVERGADAIFAGNDQIAFGILDKAAQLRIRIPEDIALVGFDDLPMAALMGLTTIRQPVEERGGQAVTMLINQLEHRRAHPNEDDDGYAAQPDPAPHVVLPTELIVRRSTSVQA